MKGIPILAYTRQAVRHEPGSNVVVVPEIIRIGALELQFLQSKEATGGKPAQAGTKVA